MDENVLKQSVLTCEKQLLQVDLALSKTRSETEREALNNLKIDIQELLELTQGNLSQLESSSSSSPKSKNDPEDDPLADEYALFMSEVNKEVAGELPKSLEGTKCKAPHKHNWGDVVYHNAMICSVVTPAPTEVKVMFTNPTHREMLPCPYYLETDCKFTEELCRFSHGEVVPFSSLRDYVEPDFGSLDAGSKVLAKRPDKLWHRATIRQIVKDKCLVKFDSNSKDVELDLHDVFPLEGDDDDDDGESDDDDELSYQDHEDIINMSLMITPSNQALGDWEKYTKGVGSKLMEKMGYVVGTGLGKNAQGRIDPVTAVILPAGKSLDHCMELREKAGGDENLFSVERKMKRQRARQREIQNKKANNERGKVDDVFNFLNDTLSAGRAGNDASEHNHRRELKKESSRDLNVASLKIEEDIKHVRRDLHKINDSLTRHADGNCHMRRSLTDKLSAKQNELKMLQARAVDIHNEQSLRKDKRKLTVF